jgi:hypothetical protein
VRDVHARAQPNGRSTPEWRYPFGIPEALGRPRPPERALVIARSRGAGSSSALESRRCEKAANAALATFEAEFVVHLRRYALCNTNRP